MGPATQALRAKEQAEIEARQKGAAALQASGVKPEGSDDTAGTIAKLAAACEVLKARVAELEAEVFKAKQAGADEQAKQVGGVLEKKLKEAREALAKEQAASREHAARIQEEASKRLAADKEIADLKAKLDAANAQTDELLDAAEKMGAAAKAAGVPLPGFEAFDKDAFKATTEAVAENLAGQPHPDGTPT